MSVQSVREECTICRNNRLQFAHCGECKNKICCECFTHVSKCPFCRTDYIVIQFKEFSVPYVATPVYAAPEEYEGRIVNQLTAREGALSFFLFMHTNLVAVVLIFLVELYFTRVPSYVPHQPQPVPEQPTPTTQYALTQLLEPYVVQEVREVQCVQPTNYEPLYHQLPTQLPSQIPEPYVVPYVAQTQPTQPCAACTVQDIQETVRDIQDIQDIQDSSRPIHPQNDSSIVIVSID